MANVFATKSGNWSDTTVWNTGALPTTADDVFANNFVVNVDTTATVLSIRNRSATGINANGSFNIVSGCNLSCTGDPGYYPGNATLVTFSLSSPSSATLNGIIPVDFSGMNATGIAHSGTGTLNITGRIKRMATNQSAGAPIAISGGGSLNFVGDITNGHQIGSSSIQVITTSGAVLNITGNIQSQNNYGNSDNPVCISSNIPCTINLTGNCSALVDSPIAKGFNLTNNSIVVNITGNLFGTNSGGQVPATINNGTVNVIGTITAGTGSAGLSSGGSTFVTGPLIMSTTAIHPLGANWRWHSSLTPTYYAVRNRANDGYRNLWTSDNTSSGAGQPATNNVRSGTVYGPTSEYTGTCAVPAAGSVALGVAVGNTTGTAVLTADAARTALGLASANLDAQFAAIPAAPSAATIAAAVWASLTSGLSTVGSVGKLLADNINATISSRSTYDGSDTAGTTTLLSRLTSGRASALDNLDASVSSRLASSGYTTPPTVTQVRQEMDSNSTKLANHDATVSSRLAGASYSAPLDAAGTRSAVGLSTGNLDTQLSGISSGISGLPSASAIASAVWAAATRTLTTAIDNSATIAAAVWGYATGRTITGGTVDTLTNAPSVPSAATIASQVRTELSTELSRIDTTVSSRLAPAGTLARVTLVDTTTTLTNAPDVPTEAEIADAVRTELAPELAHLDVDVSSRQQELARLQNVATTQEVGDIVEGALGD